MGVTWLQPEGHEAFAASSLSRPPRGEETQGTSSTTVEAGPGTARFERRGALEQFQNGKAAAIAALDELEEVFLKHAEAREKIVSIRNGGGAGAANDDSSQQPPP